jgi:hypothetical protein
LFNLNAMNSIDSRQGQLEWLLQINENPWLRGKQDLEISQQFALENMLRIVLEKTTLTHFILNSVKCDLNYT